MYDHSRGFLFLFRWEDGDWHQIFAVVPKPYTGAEVYRQIEPRGDYSQNESWLGGRGQVQRSWEDAAVSVNCLPTSGA